MNDVSLIKRNSFGDYKGAHAGKKVEFGGNVSRTKAKSGPGREKGGKRGLVANSTCLLPLEVHWGKNNNLNFR